MIQQNYNVTDRVNYGADVKRTIYTQTMQKIDIMSILGGAKNNMSKILV